MSSVASAAIETDIPYGTRNHLPDDPTYVRFDFEDGGTHFNSYPGVVNFVPLDDNKWDSVQIGERAYHIHPMDFFHNLDGSQVDYIYIVNGDRAGQPIYWWCNNVKCEWWPGSKGRIEFPTGASDVSFFISNGAPVQMKAYDKTGKYLGYSGVAYSNIERVPPNPSNFTRVSFTTEKPIIYAVEITTSQNNFWLGDDFVIGGLTLPEQPTDYSWAAERISLLDGAVFNPIGLGYNLVMSEFYTVDEIINGQPMNWDPLNKELSFSPGINDAGAIIWALNENENIVNNLYIDDMADKDFKEWIAYGDQQPGDVAFIDYEADGYYDEVVMFIEPQIDPDTGATEDCVRIIDEVGVHFVDSKYLHALYGVDNGVGVQSFMDVKSLPDSPKGTKSPYPKVPGKFKI